MTLYVDEAIYPYRGQLWCHLYSDAGTNELHLFAATIGLSRSWFQDKPEFPHYDLSPKFRAIATRNGAREITSKEMVNLKRVANGQDVLP